MKTAEQKKRDTTLQLNAAQKKLEEYQLDPELGGRNRRAIMSRLEIEVGLCRRELGDAAAMPVMDAPIAETEDGVEMLNPDVDDDDADETLKARV